MNLGHLDLQSVHRDLPRLQHSPSRHSIAASNGASSQNEADYAADTESIATAETVVRWTTPPPAQPRSHENSQSEATLRPIHRAEERNTHDITNPPADQLEEEYLRLEEAESSERPIMDEFDSSPPTPDNDNTPYIRIAIDLLTRDQDIKASQRAEASDSEASYPVERLVHDEGLGYVQSVRKVKGPALVQVPPPPATIKSEIYIPVQPQLNSPRYPDLTFVPMILRPFSMILLIFLCLLMTIALMFCAIYSTKNEGFVAYSGGLSGAQYFLFQFVPQILAAILMLYIEAVMSAVTRMVPFTMMASDNSQLRSNALFIDLYPKGLFWPRFDYISGGETSLGIYSIMLWPIIITIPLQGSLFSVINVAEIWRWTAVQGIAWTLVVIYIIAIISLALTALYFHNRSTGLMWDSRSLADIVALLPRSNSLGEYQDSEILASRRGLRARLAMTSERLGYWRTNNALQEIFYCIGEEGAATRRYTIQDGRAEQASRPGFSNTDNHNQHLDIEALSPSDPHSSPQVRHRYTPFLLRDSLLLLYPIASFFLLFALLVISFLPSTALRHGFAPLVPVVPNTAGFSPANFLYSFVPSLIGLLIYIGFRSMSSTLYRLEPWASLSHSPGAVAAESLLLDYTAGNPFLSALSHGHYLIATLALITPLSLLVPVLAGGFLFPIQLAPSNTVLMLPNLPAFYIIIIVLILGLLTLVFLAVSLLSSKNRFRYRMPNAVSCLAEIISFLYASDLVHDAAFRAVRSKADLRARLVGRRERSAGAGRGVAEVRYGFGTFRGRDGKTHVGIERMTRVAVRTRHGSGNWNGNRNEKRNGNRDGNGMWRAQEDHMRREKVWGRSQSSFSA